MAKEKTIYLDYAAATPIDPKVLGLVTKLLKTVPANPSSIHRLGQKAGQIIETSRKKVAGILSVKSNEIVFTASGSEANNLAILGFARANKEKGNHIITSKLEHHSVLRTCQRLEREGFRVSYLGVDSDGLINPGQVAKAVTSKTILISIGHANNEIGVIQPLTEIARCLSKLKNRPVFHTDACQAANYLNINCNNLGIDMMTLNGSKIYGPKGIGCLFVKNNLKIEPIIYGGDQERGLRAGTENPALIAGFAKALETAQKKKKTESKRLQELRDWTIDQILESVPGGAKLNGHPTKRLSNNINISFPNVDGETLILALDEQGIEVSTGAACTTTSTEPSHVIKALNLPSDLAEGNIRITMGRQTTRKEIEVFLKTLNQVFKKMIVGR